jgi:hypothetical protein
LDNLTGFFLLRPISLTFPKPFWRMKKITLLFTLLLAVAIAANAQDTAAQKQLLGKYKFPDGSVVPEVEVVIENGQLMMNSSAGTSSLELLKPDSFSIVSFNGWAVFKRNADKKVIGVHIEAGGYTLDGTKDTASGGSPILMAIKQQQPHFQSIYTAKVSYRIEDNHSAIAFLRRRVL